MYFGFPLKIGFTLCCHAHMGENVMSLSVLGFAKIPAEEILFHSDMLKSKSFGPLPCFDLVAFYIVANLSFKKPATF
jgi:hypothetical protein